LICHAANEVEMERRYLQLLTTYRVEGVIVNALGVREETLRPVGGGGIPAVLVDRSVEGLVADMVGLDNAEAARLGTRHLLERGFDDITFVVQPFEHVSSRRLREAAFREEIAQAATRTRGKTVVLDLADDAAVEHTLAALDRDIDAAASEGAAGKRIAWFAANAPVALRVALHLNTRYGARWQERLALLCFDDPEWAELAGISTIRQPTYDIGYRAVEFLNERIAGATEAARDCLLPGELVIRASTGR
jgi:LacI family kdg operon repressor